MCARILIASNDVIGTRMAGPGIRSWEMARYLSSKHEVFVACPGETDLTPDGWRLITYPSREFRVLAEQADFSIVQGSITFYQRFLLKKSMYLIVDLYDPFHLSEMFQVAKKNNANVSGKAAFCLHILFEQLMYGDHFLCANARQRHYWLGLLASCGKMNEHVLRSEEGLVTIVPFGVPDTRPRKGKRTLKGVVRGIREGDTVLLWGGGIWEWLDPLTVIRAMAEIHQYRDDIKLYFMGIKRPGRRDGIERSATEALELASHLGLLNRHVFFNESWVPYTERDEYLCEADVGVSAHYAGLETELSHRTRILDYIWAGLPIITSKGDALSEIVEKYQLGIVLDYGDVSGWVNGILRLVNNLEFREQCKRNLSNVAPLFTWSESLKPISTVLEDAKLKIHRKRGGVLQVSLRAKFEIGKYYLHTAVTRLRGEGLGGLYRLLQREYSRRLGR